jgi:hypothetical protein
MASEKRTKTSPKTFAFSVPQGTKILARIRHSLDLTATTFRAHALTVTTRAAHFNLAEKRKKHGELKKFDESYRQSPFASEKWSAGGWRHCRWRGHYCRRESRAFGQDSNSRPSKGDVAILRFLAAAELIESDLSTQCAELGGLTSGQPIEVDPNQSLNIYQIALSNLNPDGPQYITSNTLDEVSHATFLNAYLESKGAEPVALDNFRSLEGSQASGATKGKLRLTNLMNLNVDTSWYVRYRGITNRDLGASFPQALKLNGVPAIPRTDADFGNIDPTFRVPGNAHIQAIANVAAFHFGFIEQGGSSLYQALSQKVSSPEGLKITLAIGGDCPLPQMDGFLRHGVQQPVALFTDSATGLTFPNFFSPPQPADSA